MEDRDFLSSREEGKVRELLDVAGRLLGERALMDELLEAVSRWRSDVRKIAEGASGPLLVAVIGTKNSGKSTVVRSLVNESRIREQIPCGIAPGDGTRQLTWVGQEGPNRPIPEKERVLSTGPDGLVDLGRRFTLMDVPGFDDDGDGLLDLARDAVLAAPVKVLVVRSNELEATSVRRWSHLISKGSRILPVVVGSSGDASGEERLRQWRERNTGDPGSAALADPVWIPFVHGCAEEDLSNRIRAVVQPALAAVLQSIEDPRLLARDRAAARWRRFRHEVAWVFRPLREGLGDSFEGWREKQSAVLQEAICNLLGDREIAGATLKMDWRLRMTGRMHGFFFPQKAALSVLTVMTGRWDRLTLGVMGSVPSFFMAVAGGVGNLRRHRGMKTAIDKGLAEQLSIRSRELLTDAAAELDDRLAAVLGDSSGKPGRRKAGKLSFSWGGVEELKEWFRALMKKKMETSVSAGAGVSLHGFGLLGTVLFWSFLFGPLFALYSTFLSAWGSGDLTEFPDRGWSVLGMGILLALLPIGLLAMLQLMARPRKNEIGKIYDELREEFGREVRHRSEDGRLVLELNHPRLDDLGRLIEWMSEPSD